MEVKGRFDEVFEVEVDGWCYGLANYPGEIFPALVHRLIRELSTLNFEAISHHYVFDVIAISQKISKAAKYLVHEKEIAFSILAHLPNPRTLEEDEQFVLAQILDKVEGQYSGAIARLEKKWRGELKAA